MTQKYKLVETGEKSRVVTFRLGESVYSALEQQAQEAGGTISETARKLLLQSLASGDKPFTFNVGDTLQSSSDCVVLLVDKPLSEREVEERVNKLVRGDPERKSTQ